MKTFFGAVLVAGMLLISTTARGGLLTSNLTTDGSVDVIVDNSASFSKTFDGTNWVTPTMDHVIGVGDIVTGVMRITNSTTGGITYNSNQQLSLLFSVQIVGATGRNGVATDDWIFNLAPVSASLGSGLSIEELLSGGTSQFVTGTFSNQTVFALLESSPNPTNVSVTSIATDLSQFRTGGLYTLDLTGGIVNAADFFEATLLQQDALAGITVGELVPTAFGGSSPATANDLIGNDSGAFTSILNPLGLSFLPVPIQSQGFSTLGLAPKAIHSGQIGFTASLNVPADAQFGLGYTFANQTQIKMNVTAIAPEPGSIVIFSALSGLFGLAALRRRKIAG